MNILMSYFYLYLPSLFTMTFILSKSYRNTTDACYTQYVSTDFCYKYTHESH
jgi:hypothetical protein